MMNPSKDTVNLSSQEVFRKVNSKDILNHLQILIYHTLNSSYENLMECKNLRCFEFFKSSFFIFENHL
jgi:hypothetical protein